MCNVLLALDSAALALVSLAPLVGVIWRLAVSVIGPHTEHCTSLGIGSVVIKPSTTTVSPTDLVATVLNDDAVRACRRRKRR